MLKMDITLLFPYKLMSAVTHGCVVANKRISAMRVVSFNLFAFSD